MSDKPKRDNVTWIGPGRKRRSHDSSRPSGVESLGREMIIQFVSEYRCGQKTDRQLGAEYGVSHTTVRRWAKSLGITRDLRAAISGRTEEMLVEQFLADRKAAAEKKQPPVSEVEPAECAEEDKPQPSALAKRHRLSPAQEHRIVEANATICAGVVLSHRDAIAQARRVVDSLLSELEEDDQKTAEQLRTIANSAQADREQQIEFWKTVSRSGRVSDLRAVVDALEKLIRMERQAFNIGADGLPVGGTNAAPELTDAQRAMRLASLLNRAQKRAALEESSGTDG